MFHFAFLQENGQIIQCLFKTGDNAIIFYRFRSLLIDQQNIIFHFQDIDQMIETYYLYIDIIMTLFVSYMYLTNIKFTNTCYMQ